MLNAAAVRPLLPTPPSWYPGHMTHFTRILPATLRRTDVVLELRDARLPLTSANPHFEDKLRKWRMERGYFDASPDTIPQPSSSSNLSYRPVCERVVVFSKRDLVSQWGIEPFRKAMAKKYPNQTTFFASWTSPADIKALSKLLIDIAKRNTYAPELNVLVVGMPNVGKSTLLNALRDIGIHGPTPKALRTSSQPGLTHALSTRLKVSADPLVYAYDSPGVMMPFLGQGDRGAERGVKLALIAGIKEGLYDIESLAAYLLYRLNILDPISPAYLEIIPSDTPPLTDVLEFLEILGRRLGMLRKGGIVDVARSAAWFIKWWRDEGCRIATSTPLLTPPTIPTDVSSGPESIGHRTQQRRGWGFDLEWTVDESELERYDESTIQEKMEQCIDAFQMEREEEVRLGGGISPTQRKKIEKDELLAKRAAKYKARLGPRKR